MAETAIKQRVAEYSTEISRLGDEGSNFFENHWLSAQYPIRFVSISTAAPPNLSGKNLKIWNEVIGRAMEQSKHQIKTNGSFGNYMNGFGSVFAAGDIIKCLGPAQNMKYASELYEDTNSFHYKAVVAFIDSFDSFQKHHQQPNRHADQDGKKGAMKEFHYDLAESWSRFNAALQRL